MLRLVAQDKLQSSALPDLMLTERAVRQSLKRGAPAFGYYLSSDCDSDYSVPSKPVPVDCACLRSFTLCRKPPGRAYNARGLRKAAAIIAIVAAALLAPCACAATLIVRFRAKPSQEKKSAEVRVSLAYRVSAH